jgi:hypothetical protein
MVAKRKFGEKNLKFDLEGPVENFWLRVHRCQNVYGLVLSFILAVCMNSNGSRYEQMKKNHREKIGERIPCVRKYENTKTPPKHMRGLEKYENMKIRKCENAKIRKYGKWKCKSPGYEEKSDSEDV